LDEEACLLLLLGMAATPEGLGEAILLDAPLEGVLAATNTAGTCTDNAATAPVDCKGEIICPQGSWYFN